MDDGDAESSVSRSYYAMFYAAEAALAARGVSASSHRGVIMAFGEHFVKTGVLPAKTGRDLRLAWEARLAGDYEDRPTIAPARARVILEDARSFVAAIRAHLGEP